MTCVVGIRDGSNMVFMGDGGAFGNDAERVHTQKVFEKDGVLLGYSGDFRVGQLVRYSVPISLEEARAHGSLEGYLVTKFVTRTMNLLAEQFMPNGQEPADWSLLVGFPGGLYDGGIFVVGSDGGVVEPRTQYAAIGGGTPYALGSFYSTHGRPNIMERCVTALGAAYYHDPAVCLVPFSSVKSKPWVDEPEAWAPRL